ncbi:hypothetical protein HPB49_012038 [Dermacentor silvarum]|uniref:Uncharacterized protein n=1 Tax=Dermacentor silvarum TaxID=543639 RepID=A0ACB8C3G7_DERSI|nr:hypothetical protein HPB49_012038 [Dermacentor silvarum]
MHLGSAWRLLRSLLNPAATRTSSQHALRKILDSYDTVEALYQDPRDTYIAPYDKLTHPDYTGPPSINLDLSDPFTLHELRAAVSALQRNTCPGQDKVSNCHLRNLADSDYDFLHSVMNNAWNTGDLPSAWKHAEIIFIPKPGKPPALASLRLTSLTSSIAKLMERLVLRRLQRFLENTSYLPATLIAYREHISTQDAFLQIPHDILSGPSTSQLRAILALYLSKAFDNVTHDSMLQELARTCCGARMYNYVRSFLRGRSYSLRFADAPTSSVYSHSQRSIPQGSVLSPLLFNLAIQANSMVLTLTYRLTSRVVLMKQHLRLLSVVAGKRRRALRSGDMRLFPSDAPLPLRLTESLLLNNAGCAVMAALR